MKATTQLPSWLLVLLASASVFALVQAGFCQPSVESQPHHRALSSKQVSLYKVPLVCPAVPQIGCGSASKPLLLELQNNKAIAEAWLNRGGTIMAIVWSEYATRKQRARALKEICDEKQLAVKELTGGARNQALKDFQSGNGWYRGADVDRLSAEEAGVLGARWVSRVREKITLSDDKAELLRRGFTEAIKRKLTGKTTRSQAQAEMLSVCRENLEPNDVAVLLEAFKNELRAPSEAQ